MKKALLVSAFLVCFSLLFACNNDENSNFCDTDSCKTNIDEEDTNENGFSDNTFLNGENNIYASNFFGQDEDEYYVYYYSKMCPPCNELEDLMSSFIEDSDIKVYTLSVQNMTTDDEELFKDSGDGTTHDNDNYYIEDMIGASSIDEVYLIGTPTLYLIEAKILTAVYYGYQAIYSLIS